MGFFLCFHRHLISIDFSPFCWCGMFEQWETSIKWQYSVKKTQAYIQTLETGGGRFQQSHQLQRESQTGDDKVADNTLTAFYCKHHDRTLHAILHVSGWKWNKRLSEHAKERRTISICNTVYYSFTSCYRLKTFRNAGKFLRLLSSPGNLHQESSLFCIQSGCNRIWIHYLGIMCSETMQTASQLLTTFFFIIRFTLSLWDLTEVLFISFHKNCCTVQVGSG